MAHPEEERKALGKRLASTRNLAGYTIESAARALTERGYQISKQAVGAWEAGRNLPDALWLKRLAKLYNVSVDAMLWDESLSPDAMKIAAEYDHLTEDKQRDWRGLWLGFITGAAPGGEHLPLAPNAPRDDHAREDALAEQIVRRSMERRGPTLPGKKVGKA